jgi:hypothetical protein
MNNFPAGECIRKDALNSPSHASLACAMSLSMFLSEQYKIENHDVWVRVIPFFLSSLLPCFGS